MKTIIFTMLIFVGVIRSFAQVPTQAPPDISQYCSWRLVLI